MKVLHDRDLLGATWLIEPERLNSRSHLYPHSPKDGLVCHFCGHYDRELSVAQFARRFNLSPDLIPVELSAQYGIDVSPMSDRERYFREKRRSLRGQLKPYLKPLRDELRKRHII